MTRMAGSKSVTDFLGVKPEYGAMGAQTIADTAREFASITEGNALTANAGMKATAEMAAAQHYQDASARASSAGAQSQIVGDIASGLGGFAAKGLTGGGGGSFGNSGWGSFGDYSSGLSGAAIPGMFG